MLRLLRSTSVRLAISYAGLFIISSLLVLGFLWFRTTGYLDTEVRAAILTDVQAIGDRMRDFGLPGAAVTIAERVNDGADEHAIYMLAGPDLQRVAGNLNAWPNAVNPRPGWYQLELTRQGKSYAALISHVVLPGNFHLLVGRDVQERVVLQSQLVQGAAWAAGAALLLGIFGGLLLRRAVLGRVEMINRMAKEIVDGNLSRRLPTAASADEFDRLAQTINEMLAQIQLLVESTRNASNAIAHDLRTPIAELRARLEGVLRARPQAEATFDQIGEAVADIDRLIAIFNALLRLAEIDSGVRRSGFRRFDLADLAAEAADLYGPLSEDKGVALNVEAIPGIEVKGDPFLLAQAVGNLIDNAVKFTPPGGAISFILSRRPDHRIEVSVRDNGPGIPETEKAHVTELFYRGDSSRTTPGVGLGLSEVAAVARLHGGQLELRDNHPGLAASLILPESVTEVIAA